MNRFDYAEEYGPVEEFESARYSELATYAEPAKKCDAIDCEDDREKGCKYCLGHQLMADLTMTEMELYMVRHPSSHGQWRLGSLAEFERVRPS